MGTNRDVEGSQADIGGVVVVAYLTPRRSDDAVGQPYLRHYAHDLHMR